MENINKTFLIPNVENKSEYEVYNTRIFAVVPKKTNLICKNIFTGDYKVLGEGLKILSPWVKSKFVSLASKTVDYPKEVYKTVEGIEVTVDLAFVVSISDVKAFELNGQNPLQELGVLSKDLMRTFVATKQAEELYKINVNKGILDPTNRLDAFSTQYGLSVDSIYVKNIELPKTIKDDFEKLTEAKKRQEVARVEAETKKINAEAEANRLTILIRELRKSGLSTSDIINYLRDIGVVNGNAQVIASLGSRDSQVSPIIGVQSSESRFSNSVANSAQPSSLNPSDEGLVPPSSYRRKKW